MLGICRLSIFAKRSSIGRQTLFAVQCYIIFVYGMQLQPPEVHAFSANSLFVAKRIRKYYRRDSVVIYPPVFIDNFTFRDIKEDYYLYLGRLVAYKRVDLIVDAFAAMPDRKLIVAGDGPMLRSLRVRDLPNVRFMGAVDVAQADTLMGGLGRAIALRGNRGLRHCAR